MSDHIDTKFRRFKAYHPKWIGYLLLSFSSNIVLHNNENSRGTYKLDGKKLSVSWDRYEPEAFIFIDNEFVSEKLIDQMPDIRSLVCGSLYNNPVKISKFGIRIPGTDYEVFLRSGTSDLPTFNQIFINNEYESSNLPKQANTIIDLGGNIGLGSVFFALKYSDAQIISLEPEADNFNMLKFNTLALGQRIDALHGAIWTRNGSINLRTEADGKDLGSWGVQVSEQSDTKNIMTPCYKLSTVIENAGLDVVDILKVDIEGAELELFSEGYHEWIDRVRLIIIETHDRFRPGSESAVRSALEFRFRELPRRGENLFFARV